MLQEMNSSATVEQVDDVLAGKLIFIDWKSGMASHVYSFYFLKPEMEITKNKNP
jgi:hypothetical protein